VREKDHFRPIMGTSPDIEHRLPHDIHDRGKVVAYYCVFVLNVSGETVKVCEWKTVGELEEHRDRYSPAYRRGEAYRLACEKRKETPNPQRLSPWHTSFEKMAFKTLIRSLATSGRLPLEESKQQILMRENGLSESTDDEYDSFVNNLLEANEEPQAIGTDADPGEVREDASERILEQTPAPAGNDPWKQFEMELREAQSLGQVTAIRERWMAHFKEEADQAGVGMACDAKEDLIRHGRSDTHTPATVAP
jgi:recombinational DNA repair protein RecT